jgi:hypothetical protein
MASLQETWPESPSIIPLLSLTAAMTSTRRVLENCARNAAHRRRWGYVRERITSDGARFETIKKSPNRTGLTDLLSNVADEVSYSEDQTDRLCVLSDRLRQ